MVKSDMFQRLRKKIPDDFVRGLIYKSDNRNAFLQRKLNILEKQYEKMSKNMEIFKTHSNKQILYLQLCVIVQMFAIVSLTFKPGFSLLNNFHNMEAIPIVSNISHSMQSLVRQCMEQQ